MVVVGVGGGGGSVCLVVHGCVLYISVLRCCLILAGMVLMNLKYSAERVSAASMLALQVVDPENAVSHLLPYISWEEHSTREEILKACAGR